MAQVGAFAQKRQRLDEVITFFGVDVEGIQTRHDDAIVISMTITNYDVKKILVYNGSFVGILFYDAFCKINLPTDQLWKFNSP